VDLAVKKVAMGHNFFSEYFTLHLPVTIPPKIRINLRADTQCDYLTMLYQRAQSYSSPKIENIFVFMSSKGCIDQLNFPCAVHEGLKGMRGTTLGYSLRLHTHLSNSE
jgi:hypothetical protein